METEEDFEIRIMDMISRKTHRAAGKLIEEKLRTLGTHELGKRFLQELHVRVLLAGEASKEDVMKIFEEMFEGEIPEIRKGLFRFAITYHAYGVSTTDLDAALSAFKFGLEEARSEQHCHGRSMLIRELTNEIHRVEASIKKAEAEAKKERNKQKKLRKKAEGKSKMAEKLEDEKEEERDKGKGGEKKYEQEEERDKENGAEKEDKKEEERDKEMGAEKEDEVIEPEPQLNFTFSFKLTRKSENCFGGTQFSPRFNVEKSLINATKHQVDGFRELYSMCLQNAHLLRVEAVVQDPIDQRDMLLSESVYTIGDFFKGQLEKLGSNVTKEQWWDHIADEFKIIFRDITQGLMYLYLDTEHVCGNLSFNAYVTTYGRGKILPSLETPKNGKADDIAQLKDLMVTVIFFPFHGKRTNDLKLPLELRIFLDFDHQQCMSSAWFLIDSPFFWPMEKRIQFAHNMKKLLKDNEDIFNSFEKCLSERCWFLNWHETPEDVFCELMKYSRAGYHDRSDIFRFFSASYGHVNDRKYEKYRFGKKYKDAEIEDVLRNYFPDFYVKMWECLLHCAEKSVNAKDDVLRKEHLMKVSNIPVKNTEY